MGLRPGSYLWLVQHDMRLGARGFSDMFARRSTFAAWAAGISGVVAMHLLAWPAVIWLQPMIEAPGSELYIIVVLGCILAWVVAQGVLGATRLLFARGDLDLLLGSPLPVTRVFAARATALAAGSFGSIALMTLPIANVGAVLDRLSWLALYPVLAALALAGTGLGIAIGMGLFYIVGPRHARLIAQLSAALIAGAFVLGVQIVALLPKPMRTAFFDMIGAGGRSSWFDEGASMRVLIGAVRGEAEPVAWVFAASLALFGLVVVVLGRAFAHATIRTAGAPPEGDGALSEGRRPVQFTSGLGRSLRRKEWRLMLRDPNMAAQFALQLIYTVPVAVILMRSKIDFPTAMAVAPRVNGICVSTPTPCGVDETLDEAIARTTPVVGSSRYSWKSPGLWRSDRNAI